MSASQPTLPLGHDIPKIPDLELLERIGSGGYGEVWLGRNALGTFRAVKIVRRAEFEDERPYEHEFAGIRKFEPISRLTKDLWTCFRSVAMTSRAGSIT